MLMLRMSTLYLLICRDGLGHGVCTTILRLLLAVIKLEQVAELIALALVDQRLTINFCELIIMSEYFDFFGHEVFISIIMALNNQSINTSEVIASGTILAHLRKDEVVVAISKNTWYRDALLYGNLIIVAVDRQALHGVLFCDLEPRVVIIQRQVNILYRRCMMALLRRSCLILVLRRTWSTRVLLLSHRLLLSRCGRLLTRAALANCKTAQLVEIHQILKLGDALEQLLDAVGHGVHLLLLILLLLLLLVVMVWLAGSAGLLMLMMHFVTGKFPFVSKLLLASVLL